MPCCNAQLPPSGRSHSFSSYWEFCLLRAQQLSSWPRRTTVKGSCLPNVTPSPNESACTPHHLPTHTPFVLTWDISVWHPNFTAIHRISWSFCCHHTAVGLQLCPSCFPHFLPPVFLKASPQQINLWLRICFPGIQPRKVDTRNGSGSQS